MSVSSYKDLFPGKGKTVDKKNKKSSYPSKPPQNENSDSEDSHPYKNDFASKTNTKKRKSASFI